MAALLLIGAGLTGLVSLPLGSSGSSGSRAEQEVPQRDAHPSNSRTATPKEPGAEEPLDVLVLGVDRRPEGDYIEGSRADSIMVARVFTDTGRVKVLSIPRDLFVEIEPGIEDRINAAYAYGGVPQIATTVERLTGISMDRYAVVDFQGFVDIVDAVDGVTVEVQGEMPRGWRMEGKQTLDGEQALLYTRYRGTPGGDLDRIARQQQVVSALHDQVLSWRSLSDLPEIVQVTRKNVETDSGFVESLSLGRAVLRNEAGQVEALQLKGAPATTPDGRQVLMPDREENERLVWEFERLDAS